MKLDLDLLVMRLGLEGEGTVLPPASCNEYLVDHVLLPLLRGERVRLGDIDYTAFDGGDIGELSEYNELVYEIARSLEQTAERMGNIVPVALSVRHYC